MKNWYVIQTKPAKELQVHTLLSRAGYAAYYPKLRELQYRGRLAHYLLKPLFPCYVFVHADFLEERHYHNVKFTRGAVKVLGSGERPLPIPDEAMRAIQSRTDAYGILEWSTLYRKGQKVRIKRGPFKDLIGILEKPCPEQDRVRVLLQLVGCRMSVPCHWSELENPSPTLVV